MKQNSVRSGSVLKGGLVIHEFLKEKILLIFRPTKVWGNGAIDPTSPFTPFPTALYCDTAFLPRNEPKTIKKGMLCPKIAYEDPPITRILGFGKKRFNT